jgi:hypothetical protein
MIIYTGHNMEDPRTPRSEQGDGIGELNFADETFGKKNGAINNTPERTHEHRIISGNKRNTNRNKGMPPTFAQWPDIIMPEIKKGGKTRKRKTRKTRSRKHKKSHKKSHKKKSHKKTNRKSKRSRKRVTRRRARMRGGFLSGWFTPSNATETPAKKELTKEEKDRIMAEMNAEHEAELEDYGMRG